MLDYVRLSFRDGALLRDERRVKQEIARTIEELDTMNYYHSIYEAKKESAKKEVIRRWMCIEGGGGLMR